MIMFCTYWVKSNVVLPQDFISHPLRLKEDCISEPKVTLEVILPHSFIVLEIMQTQKLDMLS